MLLGLQGFHSISPSHKAGQGVEREVESEEFSFFARSWVYVLVFGLAKREELFLKLWAAFVFENDAPSQEESVLFLRMLRVSINLAIGDERGEGVVEVGEQIRYLFGIFYGRYLAVVVFEQETELRQKYSANVERGTLLFSNSSTGLK